MEFEVLVGRGCGSCGGVGSLWGGIGNVGRGGGRGKMRRKGKRKGDEEKGRKMKRKREEK